MMSSRRIQRYSLLLVLALLAPAASAWAQSSPTPSARPTGAIPGAFQSPSGRIAGAVVDAASGQPIASATIAVWNAADSTLVTGAVADADGRFLIENMRPGRYYVRVSFMGYGTETVPDVALTPQQPQAALGRIRLTEDVVQLGEVAVTGERAAVTFALDRTIYSTKDQLTASGGTATDLLQQVPSVEVDLDGRISLRGNQNVAIHINGKPAPMQGDFLTSYLQQLPASAIERVEVVPNPSAKYDPDGMAGILNIVLKQNTEVRGGGITLGLGTWNRYNAAVNGNYQKDRLSLFGYYGFRSDTRDSKGSNWREYRFDTALPFLDQWSESSNENLGHNLNGGLDYSLSKLSTLSFNANLNLFNGENAGFQDYALLGADRVAASRYRRDSGSDARGRNGSLTATFRRVVEAGRNELTVETRFSRNSHDNFNTYGQVPLSLDGLTPGDAVDRTANDTENENTDWLGQIDYTLPLGARGKLETGYKGLYRLIDNRYTFSRFDAAQNGYLPVAGMGNEFDFDEQQHAVYGIVSQGIGKFDLQAGVRLEQATTNFSLLTTSEHYDNDYFSIFPSAIVSYKPTEGQQWKVSYSKRINRPDAHMLNPFVPSDDPLNVFSGNPYLKPQYTHSVEGGYQMFSQRGSVGISPFYRRTVDAWAGYSRVDDQGVNRFTIENLATNESYGIEANGSIRMGRRLNLNTGVNVFKRVTDGSNVESGLGANAITWFARANGQYEVRPGLNAEFFLMYRPRMKTEQGYFSGMTMSSLGFRQQLMGGKANLSLRVQDPLDLMRMSGETNTDRMFSTMRRDFDSRVVYLTFQYNFGKQVNRPRRNQNTEGDTQQTPQVDGLPMGQ